MRKREKKQYPSLNALPSFQMITRRAPNKNAKFNVQGRQMIRLVLCFPNVLDLSEDLKTFNWLQSKESGTSLCCSIFLMNRTRRKFKKVENGNNYFGRNGNLRCDACRNRRRKVKCRTFILIKLGVWF